MPKKRKGIFARLRKVPHLFAKVIIIHCVFTVTVAAYWSLYAQHHGANMTELFIAISAAFVSELAMLLLKTLFKKDLPKEETEDEDNVEQPGI